MKKKQENALELACDEYANKNKSDATEFQWYTDESDEDEYTWRFKDGQTIVRLVLNKGTNEVSTIVT